MAHVLHIDASPRGDRSHTRRLTRELIDTWRKAHPGDTVLYRDLGRDPPPAVDESWIAAAFTPPRERTPAMRQALHLSDGLVEEFLAAEVYVMGVPMYNFTVPAAVKAYIDQIVRVGRTFAFEPEDDQQPYRPLVHGRKMFVIVASGDSGYDDSGPLSRLNHLEPYLRAVFGFIGVTDLTFIYVGNDEFGGRPLERSLARARARIVELIAAQTTASADRRFHRATSPAQTGTARRVRGAQ